MTTNYRQPLTLTSQPEPVRADVLVAVCEVLGVEPEVC